MCTKCRRQDGVGWRAGLVFQKPNQPFLRKKLHESEMTGFSSSSSTTSLPANHCTLSVEWEWSPPLRCADDTGDQDICVGMQQVLDVCWRSSEWKCGCGQELSSPWVRNQTRLKILLFFSFFKLKCSWFTMLCQSLLYNRMAQFYIIYTCTFSL